MSIVDIAAKIAREAHKDQRRKWEDVPYFVHPERVAAKVATLKGCGDIEVAAAFLHDTCEDTPYPQEEIERQVGKEVLDLVLELTSPSEGPEWKNKRRIEKRIADWAHLLTVSRSAKRIKMVDRWDNLQDMNKNTPSDYLRKYLVESRVLLEILKPADKIMAAELEEVIEKGERKIWSK